MAALDGQPFVFYGSSKAIVAGENLCGYHRFVWHNPCNDLHDETNITFVKNNLNIKRWHL